jgi:hypothetical protein
VKRATLMLAAFATVLTTVTAAVILWEIRQALLDNDLEAEEFVIVATTPEAPL